MIIFRRINRFLLSIARGKEDFYSHQKARESRFLCYNEIMKPIILEELSSPGCHNCAEFEKWWHTIEAEHPNVQYKNVSILSPEGQELAGKHMIMASPGILLNGELFCTGGVDKGKFLEKLKTLS
jgi:alkyl hydroperoxide reductase subunit AhpF